MTEKVTWIVFHAHPTQFVQEEDFHPDFRGVFVAPLSRPEPESLLKEVLGNRKLSLIDISNTQLKAKADDWGINERLKRELDDQGYGISLVKMQPKPAEMD